RSVIKRRQPRQYHPIPPCLCTHYRGCPARRSFLFRGETRLPSGAPPWPCLNPASEHYRELRIEECAVKNRKTRIKDPQRKPHRRPVGKFVCDCGFAYSRIGPDASEEDRYQIGRVIEFGTTWESKLRTLRCDGVAHTS